MKNKGNKQGSKQGSSPYLLDRNLTPRIEQYALNHDISNPDEVVDYLRRSYKEYQRRPVAALRQMVVKAVQVVQRKGVAKPEVVLQARERQHTQVTHQPSTSAAANNTESSADDEAPRALHYADLGGIEEVLADIKELIEYPLKHPEVYGWLGVEPPRGVLLHGPPGCGKTALAHAIATECGVPFLRVSAPEVVSGMSGESEARLRQLFQEAQDVAPSVIFIDEIDAIAPKRENAQREMERRAGRFDREITLGIPTEAARQKILRVLTRNLRLQGLAITMSDFERALPKVQPSVRREGFTTKPDATWEDVGSLEEVREELSFSISQPIAHPEAFAAMGLSAASGVLLYGPPGCGKTLVAKAVAADSGANFISIKGPELLNKYVGESERAVRQLFARARAAHPCVLFFDEMDALAPRRGSDNNAPAERLGVYVIAATNRPDMIDPALLRPGRLDKVLYVPLPPADGRASILAAAARRTPMAPAVMVQAQELVSVSKRDRRSYEAMRSRLRGARAHLPATVSDAAGVEGPAGATVPDADAAGVETQSKMEADDVDAAAALAGTAAASGGGGGGCGGGEGDGMEGTDDAPEPEDPMKDD
eukprot:gene5385-5621_t